MARKMTVTIGNTVYDAQATGNIGNTVTVWYLNDKTWLIAGVWSMAAYHRVCAKGANFKV